MENHQLADLGLTAAELQAIADGWCSESRSPTSTPPRARTRAHTRARTH
jgi:hypothetical protein